MKRTIFYIYLFLLVACVDRSYAQRLQPGFDAKEYANALFIAFGKYDSMMKLQPSPLPSHYTMVYNSKVTGLDNRWNLWLQDSAKQAVINIRGTVASNASWLANIYAAMVPAKGSLKLNDSTTFQYQLAVNDGAAVHIGWLISLGYLAADIEQKIKEQYANGVKDFIIMGHSQGGAIAFLLRSYLYYRTKEGALPGDIIYKTYCSAAPKPGNLHYAYDFEAINGPDWAFTVVNAADWVPETPISIQQLSDFNTLNPFTNISRSLSRQRYIVRLYANIIYSKLSRSTRKATRKYEKYLGKKIGKRVKQVLPQLQTPLFVHSMDYMPAGTPVVLMPDDAYFKQFPNNPDNRLGIWIHHTFRAYYYLVQHRYLTGNASADK